MHRFVHGVERTRRTLGVEMEAGRIREIGIEMLPFDIAGDESPHPGTGFLYALGHPGGHPPLADSVLRSEPFPGDRR